MKNLLLLFCFLCLKNNFSQEKNNLAINPGGHLAMIKKLLLAPGGKNILSAGDDKTVKVWGMSSVEPLYEFLGQTGEGIIGSISAIALSPDGNYLAVVGNFSESLSSLKGSGDIRLYDYKTRKIIKVLKGHSFLCYAVAFSADGKKLISGSGDMTIKLWDVESGKDEKTFKGHTKEVYDLAFAGKDKIVSCALDGTVRLWNISSGKEENKSDLHKGIITKVMASKDGKIIYSGCEDKNIFIYDEKLNKTGEIKVSQQVASMAMSADEKHIAIGGWSTPFYCEVVSKKSGTWKTISAYSGHDLTVSAITFLNDTVIASGGGANNEIHIWKFDEFAGTDILFIKNSFKLTGNGSKMCAVGFYENIIGFSDACKQNFGKSDVTYWFDLLSRGIGTIDVDNRKLFKGIYTEVKGQQLLHSKGGDYGMNAILNVGNKEAYFQIKKGQYTGFGHTVYSFSADGKRIVSGGTGNVHVYNANGDLLAELVGHTGDIIALWVSEDGKKIVTGAYDQSIRIWDVSNLKDKPDFIQSKDIDPAATEGYKKYFPEINYNEIGGVEKLHDAIKNKTGMSSWLNWVLTTNVKKAVEPIASIFIGLDNEWVIWCNDGYYSSSRKGGKYIGFHINQGQEKEAKFYPFEQFDLKFNRPDIINQRLSLGDTTLNSLLKAAHIKRLKKAGFEEKNLGTDLNAPVVSILTQAQETDKDVFSIDWTANDDKYLLDRANIYVNDVPVLVCVA